MFAKLFLVAPKKFKDLRLRLASWESFTTLNEVYGIEKVCKSNFHTWSKCAPISPWKRRMKHVYPLDKYANNVVKKMWLLG